MTVLTVKPQGIPDELKQLGRWAVWHHQVDDRGHVSKPPLRADHSGARAYASAPETWASFDQAYACYEAHRDVYEGISFALVETDGIIGVDLDHVEEHLLEATEIVRTLDTYTELSPSTEGLRLFCYGYLPPGRRIRDWVEMYSGKRFLTVTGRAAPHLGSDRVQLRQTELEAVWGLYVQQAWRPLSVAGRHLR